MQDYCIKGREDFWPTIERFARDTVAVHPGVDAVTLRNMILSQFGITFDWREAGGKAEEAHRRRFMSVAIDALQPPCGHGIKASSACQECMLETLAVSTGLPVTELRARLHR